MRNSLIIQSHRNPLPYAWMTSCLASVERWATRQNADYRFLGDELFDHLPASLGERVQSQPVVASDLARLLVLRDALKNGCEIVVWCDADFLIFDPDNFAIPTSSYSLGREVWIQNKRGKPAAYVKVHNAFMSFTQGNPFLDFYIHACERLLMQHTGPSTPQLIGPKFLSAIHNVIQCPVAERAGVMSPMLALDLISGGGAPVELFLRRGAEMPAGLNLCASSVISGELSDEDMEEVIALLLASPGLFQGFAAMT